MIATLTQPMMPKERLLTPKEFMEIVYQGTLPDMEKLELIRGRMVEKMPKNAPHEFALMMMMKLLFNLTHDKYCLRCQSSLILMDSVLEPDLALVIGPDRKYMVDHPTTADTLLVVEVSDSSLSFDLGDKLEAYALSKIREYWVVDIPNRQVHVFTQPKAGKKPGYKSRVDYGEKDTIPVVIASEHVGQLAVKEILP
jgi:Uma2 family endonuclease